MSATIQDIVDSVRLLSIDYYHVHAAKARQAVEHADEETEVEPRYAINIARKEDGSAFRVKLRTDIDSLLGEISVEVGVEYAVDDLHTDEITDVVMLDFVNNVAIMTMIPYVRSGVADVTSRVFGSSLLMPIIQRGELVFAVEDAVPVERPVPAVEE